MNPAKRSAVVWIWSNGKPIFNLVFYGVSAVDLYRDPMIINSALVRRGLDPTTHVATPRDIYNTSRDSDKDLYPRGEHERLY